ncbi:hypothetical protein [Streptomyces sp. NPDC046727]|uniref:hypothetical protein n=1 Tax=Streptomyces sp. NPDC046727 TaxID=3155373 RepID=UPI0033D87E7E
MAPDNDTDRTAGSPEPERHTPSRVPPPLACALAAVTVPLALHLPTPRPANPLPTLAGTIGPTAPASTLPTPTGIAPTPTSTVPDPTGTPPPLPSPRGTSTSTTRPTTKASPPASPAPPPPPAVPPPARPANTPWTLRADRLVLRALAFRGTVTVRTAAGPVRVLKFTARSVDAVDLDVTAGRGRAAMRLRTGPGTRSTFTGRGGTGVVTFYISKLSGTVTALDGAALPPDPTVTLTPDAMPRWLAHPATAPHTVTVADATVSTVAQSVGSLSVTGLLLHPVGSV